jgi:hypothetical protein
MKYIFTALFTLFLSFTAFAQDSPQQKADAVLKRAVEVMGGARYLAVRSQIGKGRYSSMRDGAVISFQSFSDTIVFPDKERTEFRGQGSRIVQVNTGMSGWIYDGDQELIKVQTEKQVADFQRGVRTSLDNLLRGQWRGQAELRYVGKRLGVLGKRNDLIKLTYSDALIVEFEFADDGTPQKALYKRPFGDGGETKEEDRYAQFNEVDGVKAPFIIDHYSDGRHTSRINYDSIEFNRNIPESVFAKPRSAKEAKKQGN